MATSLHIEKNDIENCLAAFQIGDFTNRVCHLHHQARQLRKQNDSYASEIQDSAKSIASDHAAWLSLLVVQGQIWLAGLVFGNDCSSAAYQWIVKALQELDQDRGYRAASKLVDALNETWARDGEINAWEIVARVFDVSWKMVRNNYTADEREENRMESNLAAIIDSKLKERKQSHAQCSNI